MRYGELAADSVGADDDRPALVLLHGLTFNRQHWAPVLADPAIAESNRRVVTFDLPGHGESPRRDSYRLADLADALHTAITEARLDRPVVVGHSAAGVLATAYAARYPVRGVVNVDQPLRVGGFSEFLRQAEPVLNSDDFLKVWETLLGGMHLDELPPPARELVQTVSTPRQDLFLGYWRELIDNPEQAGEDISRALAAIRGAGVPYHYIAGSAVEAGYRAWLEAALPAVAITELPGSGHFPHLVHPAEVAKILAHFAVPADAAHRARPARPARPSRPGESSGGR
jgi:pimeloyl-ACP methyl ester carboxylesterase